MSPTEPPVYKATFAGLHKWYTHVFEKFGWMILANHESSSSSSDVLRKRMAFKLTGYENMILSLQEAIDEKQKRFTESDRKDDLAIMASNFETLLKYWNTVKDIPADGRKRRRSKKKRSSRRSVRK